MNARTPAVMIQGTASHVGKSTLVAGLARAFVRRGLKVAPFKPQNMSNNAAVTIDGGEIGRAQAVQARAARIQPSVHMNPVLLKPESDTGAQIIVQGRRTGTLQARDYTAQKSNFLPAVLESFGHLTRQADIVLVEGAGSPAETNLRTGDIANMGFAEAADVPVILAGDIDRGGVIASLVGTFVVLQPRERERVRGFLINKFRGDPTLFDEGVKAIEGKTSWPSLGVVPWLPQAAWLPAEDALDLGRNVIAHERSLTIAVPMFSRIANFDDLDPLGMEPNVRLVFVRPGDHLPPDAKVVVLPGSKSTIADLTFMRDQGWDIDLKALVRRGCRVLGLCGGYQMLGRKISDPEGIEGPPESVEGLGLLDVTTTMTAVKSTTPVSARHCTTGADVTGYEIHLGRTQGSDCARPMLTIEGRPEGATSPDGRVQGTYVHGLFCSDTFRRAWLTGFGVASKLAYDEQLERAIDALADHLEKYLDVNRIIEIARERQKTSASAA